MQRIEQLVMALPPFPHGQVPNSFLTSLKLTEEGRRLESVCKSLLERKPSLDSMPNGLREFHRVVGYLYDDVEGIARKHLAIEYICCGLPPHKLTEQFDRVYEIRPGPIRLTRLPPLFAASEREYLTCPECDESQIGKYGFSFVHRRTGAPFVDVCCFHGCDLRPADGQMFLFDQVCRGQRNAYQRSMSVEFAKRVSDSMEISAEVSPYRKEAVRSALRLSGWANEDGRLRLSSLLREFPRFFSDAFSDARLQYLATSEVYTESAIRNLTRADRAVHPVWCILFAWFASACQMKRTEGRTSTETKRVEPSPEELRLALKQHHTIAKTATALSISESRAAALCKRYRIDVAWRPKFVDAALQDAIAIAFARGETPRQVGSRFRISLSTAYRILASQEHLLKPAQRAAVERTQRAKAQWCKALVENPSLSVTSLRRMLPATWAQLYRAAPEWLSSNSRRPKSPQTRRRYQRPNQPILEMFARAVCDAECACADEACVPLRKSFYRIRHATGVSEYAVNRCRKQLSSTQTGESHNAFAIRRIRWALKRVNRPGKGNWLLAKTAQLRPETVTRVLNVSP